MVTFTDLLMLTFLPTCSMNFKRNFVCLICIQIYCCFFSDAGEMLMRFSCIIIWRTKVHQSNLKKMKICGFFIVDGLHGNCKLLTVQWFLEIWELSKVWKRTKTWWFCCNFKISNQVHFSKKTVKTMVF